MGYNTHTWDKEAHYSSRSTKQLQAELTQFREGLERLNNDTFKTTTAVGWFETHIEYLRMKIAERIGK